MTDRQDFDEDPQLRALVQQGDPARALRPADPEALARLLEHTMADPGTGTGTDMGTGTAAAGRRGVLTWLAGAAAVAVVAGGGLAVASSMQDDEPTVPAAATSPSTTGQDAGEPSSDAAGPAVTLRAPTPGARCAAPTPEILSQFDTSFVGTVTAVDGDVVTIEPSEVFAGESAEEIEIVGAMPDPRLLDGVVSFEVGGTYYVSASGGEVSACGYSGPAADSQLAQLYDVAFR